MANDIVLKNVTKRYKNTVAVDNLSLEIKGGEFVLLLGVNGAGKTTTIKMLSCLTAPDEGEAFLGGHSVRTEASEVKKIIGVSPQETAVAPLLTVRENVEFIAGIYGFSKEKIKEKTEETLFSFGLTEEADKKAKNLSGGMMRRLSIALALVSEPEILFLDEPTLGLDVIARRELWKKISALKGKITVVLTTHYLEEAEALSDRIAVMKKGKLLTVGTADEIVAETGEKNFEDAFVALTSGGSL